MDLRRASAVRRRVRGPSVGVLPAGVARFGVRGESFGSFATAEDDTAITRTATSSARRPAWSGSRRSSVVVGRGVLYRAAPGTPGGGIGRGVPPPGRAVKQSDHELILLSTAACPPPGRRPTPPAAPSQVLRVSKGHQRVPSVARPGQHDPGDGTDRYGRFALNAWSRTCVAGRGDRRDASTEDDGGAHPFGAGEPRNVAPVVDLWWERMTAADRHAHASPMRWLAPLDRVSFGR